MNRYRTLLLRVFAIGIVLSGMTGLTIGQSSSDPLEQGFQQPPDSAKPRVWWHWMNGNISKEGIKLDLEWMHRVRTGRISELRCRAGDAPGGGSSAGLHDAGVEGRFQIRDHPGRSTGNGKAIAGSPGWSETGGPWVPASQGMKKYVWSETFVEGGKPFTGTLAHPPSNTGAFQNMGVRDSLAPPAGAPAPPQYLR